MAANFPNSPSNGDEFTSGGVTFTWDGSAWKLNSSSGTKGDKGTTGSDGSDGDKGQKGATGSGGSTGSQGQKGEPGAGQTPAIEVGTRTSNYQTSSESYQTAITVTINPTVSGSTLLVTAAGIMAGYHQSDYDDPTGATPACRVYRGSTAIGQELVGGGIGGAGNYTGYKKDGFNLTFKDTYNHGGNNVTYYLKIRRYNTDEHVHMRKGTTLTVQEII